MGRDIQNFYPSLVDKFFLARAFSKIFQMLFAFDTFSPRFDMGFSEEKW